MEQSCCAMDGGGGGGGGGQLFNDRENLLLTAMHLENENSEANSSRFV